MSAQLPHPVQSIADTWILYCRPSRPLPAAFLVSNPSGALAASSSVNRNGLIAAWGHTNEHWLHWIQLSICHSGTSTAIHLFSYAAVPWGKWPSSRPLNADTGKELPSTAVIGLSIFLMNSGSPIVANSASSTASAQAAGTSILTRAFIPFSTASLFMLTILSPFLP